MFNSTILDVVIGLVFIFSGVALFVSSITEFIATHLKWRHQQLETGIKWLLNDPDVFEQLYNHALINPLSVPISHSQAAKVRIPAYIPSKNFACALTDIIGKIPQDFEALHSAVSEIADPQLKQVLEGFLARSDQKITIFEKQVADWFDNAMDRVSGFYKRKTQAVAFGIALIIAIGLNINACDLFVKLWDRPALSQALTSPHLLILIDRAKLTGHTSAAQVSKNAMMFPVLSVTVKNTAASSENASVNNPAYATQFQPAATTPSGPTTPDNTERVRDVESTNSLNDMLGAMRTLPIGWTPATFDRMFPRSSTKEGEGLRLLGDWASFIVGIFITASAALFGAPFWFDLLQQLIQIRGTGTKPLTRDQAASRNTKPTRTP